MTNTELSHAKNIILGTTEAVAMYIGNTQVWKKLPYDAEVEYLQSSSGTQYIDTGITNNSTVIIDMKMSAQGIDMLNGAEQNTNNRYKWGINGSGYLYYGFQNSYTSSSITGNIDVPYIYHMEAGNCYINSINNTTCVSGQGSISQYSSHSITLFKCYSGTKFMSSSSGTMRIYYCNINKSSNNTNMQLIPVRIGQVGYMYDKVSGQLFSNAGTGNFTLGPDVT